MRIRFETTVEDIVAFNRFHLDHSPAIRRQRLILTLLGPAVLGLVAWFDYQSNDEPEFWIFALVFSAIWSIGFHFWFPWRTARNVRKLLSEGSNHSVLGWREMELVNNRLIVKLKLIDSSYDLCAIDKIVSNEKYTFVYISSLQAFLIPMTLYPEEEYRQFVAELLDAWDHRETPRQPARPRDERIVEGPA